MLSNVNFSLEPIESLYIFKTNPKLLQRLRLNTDDDNYYETHQLYKTIHFRCVSSDLIDESIDLIYNGLVYFTSKNQLHCIFDLAKVFVETLKKSPTRTTPDAVDAAFVQKCKFIHNALRDGAEEQNEFTAGVLKWSGSLFVKQASQLKSLTHENALVAYQKKFGHVDLHREFALNMWSEKNYIKARYHFLHSTDAESFSQMMIECHRKYGYPSEADLFLTQSVLQFLCLSNLTSAIDFYTHYVKNNPLVDTNKPLVNFLNFLFAAIKLNKVNLFNVLLELYKPSLDRDTSYYDYLDRIGQMFFNLKPKKVEKESMFSNLMRMLTTTPSSQSNDNQATNTSSSIDTNKNTKEEDEDEDDWNSFKDDDIDDNDLLD